MRERERENSKKKGKKIAIGIVVLIVVACLIALLVPKEMSPKEQVKALSEQAGESSLLKDVPRCCSISCEYPHRYHIALPYNPTDI